MLDALDVHARLIAVPNPSLMDNHQEELAEEYDRQGYLVWGKLGSVRIAAKIRILVLTNICLLPPPPTDLSQMRSSTSRSTCRRRGRRPRRPTPCSPAACTTPSHSLSARPWRSIGPSSASAKTRAGPTAWAYSSSASRCSSSVNTPGGGRLDWIG